KKIRNHGSRKTCRECIHWPGVEPVVEGRVGLLRVEPDPGVAQSRVAGHSPQENHSGPGVDRFGARLLIAAISECRLPPPPRIARVNIEVTQEGEHTISAVDICAITTLQI